MEIHVTDCDEFDHQISIELPCSIYQLLESIKKEFKIDTSFFSVYHNEKELEFGFQLTENMINTDNTIVLFNHSIYEEKSFQRVDNPINLPNVNFTEYYNNMTIENNSENLDFSTQNSDLENSYYLYLQSQISPQYISINPEEQLADVNNIINTKNRNENQTPITDLNNIESLNDLTEIDLEAIDRLEHLGYDRVMAIQMYLVCDRNEETALQLLRSL